MKRSAYQHKYQFPEWKKSNTDKQTLRCHHIIPLCAFVWRVLMHIFNLETASGFYLFLLHLISFLLSPACRNTVLCETEHDSIFIYHIWTNWLECTCYICIRRLWRYVCLSHWCVYVNRSVPYYSHTYVCVICLVKPMNRCCLCCFLSNILFKQFDNCGFRSQITDDICHPFFHFR